MTSGGDNNCLQRETLIGTSRTSAHPLAKLPSGIEGFDYLSHGGFPQHRTSSLIGGPGAGKTVLALQCLVNGARHHRAPGIFVAFEESPSQIIANGNTFDWGLAGLMPKKLFIMDAHLSPTLIKAGDFDLVGMLAMLAAKKQEIGAQWIVFDGIDVLLTLLQDPAAEMRELYRLRDWLAENALTAILTAKAESRSGDTANYGFLQFMVDCVVRLERHQEDRISVQTLQITKYRGSGFAAAEFPLSFGPSGIEVGATKAPDIGHKAPMQRISAGFERLDAMLGGGVFRGSSTLITGVPGTSKTTLEESSSKPPVSVVSVRCSSASTRAPSRSCATCRPSASRSRHMSSPACCACIRPAPKASARKSICCGSARTFASIGRSAW